MSRHRVLFFSYVRVTFWQCQLSQTRLRVVSVACVVKGCYNWE